MAQFDALTWENQTAPSAGWYYVAGKSGSGSTHGSVIITNTTQGLRCGWYAHYGSSCWGMWLPAAKGDSISASASTSTVQTFRFYPAVDTHLPYYIKYA